MFLRETIDDILKHSEEDIEIIAVLDGAWADPEIPVNPKVTLIHHPKSVGQRAATNEAARIARGKYLMKVDAHCSFAQGFDRIMLADMQPDWTMIPVMKNLHAFDWVCPDGHRRYQGPSGPCTECGKETVRDILWLAKNSPQSTSYRFDKFLHFQYWPEYKKQQTGDLVETMSIQGSCFLVTRDKYFELDLCDENHGSWGQQGVEVACKTWLSGGRVIVNKKTWYAHMFRTQGGDFGFPYPNPGIEKARSYSRELWLNDKWDKAVHPLSWLIEKFSPVPDWEDYKDLKDLKVINSSDKRDLTWSALYYTNNKPEEELMKKCQKQILKGIGNHRLVSVSLKPIDFGENLCLPDKLGIQLESGGLTQAMQILAGLEMLDSDYVFFTECDVLYHPSHFDFVPPEKDKYYYNINVWKLRMSDGHAIHYDVQSLSGICAYRELLLEHYKKKIEKIKEIGWSINIGYEPGTHDRPERVDDYKAESWKSEWPNIDLRHASHEHMSKAKWSLDDFVHKEHAINWIENDNIPGWGHMWHFWKRI